MAAARAGGGDPLVRVLGAVRCRSLAHPQADPERRGAPPLLVTATDDLGRAHLYGHLQKITARVGQMLDQGDKLGHLGSTGHSTGPHVHYEVRNPKGVHLNPVTVLFPGRRIAKGYAWTDVLQQEVGSSRFAARSR